MTPQLFINYKLKSVAHMPWRVMGYKFFSTFIDDVFSFLVAMPTSHRVACFRDDLVFLIFLYQRWCYPVDKKRANEYGYAYDDGDDSDKLAAAAAEGADAASSSDESSSSEAAPTSGSSASESISAAGAGGAATIEPSSQPPEGSKKEPGATDESKKKNDGASPPFPAGPGPEDANSSSSAGGASAAAPAAPAAVAAAAPRYRTVEELREGLERRDPLLMAVLGDRPGDGLSKLAAGAESAAKLLDFGDDKLLRSLLRFVQHGVDAEALEVERRRATAEVLADAAAAGIDPGAIRAEYQRRVGGGGDGVGGGSGSGGSGGGGGGGGGGSGGGSGGSGGGSDSGVGLLSDVD